MVARRQPRHMTVDEWRQLERANPDVKYEYIDGQVYLMSGGSLAHSRIGINVVRVLEDALENAPCYVYDSGASVRLSETRYTYPDATVSCDPGDKPVIEQIQVVTPRVVVEVLSDSTEGKDRIKKAFLYRACPSIQEYVLVATRYQAVEVQRRTGDEWTLHLFGPGDEVELVSVGVCFPLTALYTGTQTPTEELVQDLLSIVTVFSGWLYGSRAKNVRSCVSHALKDCLKAEETDGTSR